jgi:hypothetical protein
MVKLTTVSKSGETIFRDLRKRIAVVLKKVKFFKVCQENFDSDNISDWFEVDCSEPEHKVLSDREIVKCAQEQSGETDECVCDDIPLDPEKHISHTAALEWAESLLDYYLQQHDLSQASAVKNERCSKEERSAVTEVTANKRLLPARF